MAIAYEILSGNKVRVSGDGINVEYPTDEHGAAFATSGDAEAFAVSQIQRIERERAGLQYIYVHVGLSGGDGRNDPVGVANDGVEGLNVLCTARQSEDPSSPVITAMPDRAWRLLLRRAEDNSEYEIINATMTAGVMAFTYKTTNQLAVLVKIDPKDMDEVFEIGGFKYGIRLVGDLKFKVYRRM